MNTRNPDYRSGPCTGHHMPLLVLCLLLAGCGIEKPFPDKGLYTIDAGRPDAGGPATQPVNLNSPIILQVPQLRIATPYDGNSFVYRLGPQKYTADYYNGFIASPAAILTGQLVAYLGHSGLYSYVVDGNSSVDYTQVLEGNITELYGDYTRPRSPQAVIAIRFFVLRPTSNGILIEHDRLYRAVQPAKGDSAESLVDAWGTAYRRIMDDLIADLRTMGAPPGPPGPQVSTR